MNMSQKFLVILCTALLMGCGGTEERKNTPIKLKDNQSNGVKNTVSRENVVASQWVDLVNTGVGPVKSIELTHEIDRTMVERGAAVYNRMCTACHRLDKKFVGPPVKGVLDRRTPEWVMNMVLNPNEMLQKDPIAIALFKEFYGVPMVNQNLSHDDARAILEYYRTLD